MRFFQYFFFDHFFRFVQLKPDDIASVRHQGCDVPVAQMKNPFNDFLFGFFNSSLFGSFIDDRLDLIFRYIAFGGRFDGKQHEKKIAQPVQQGNDGITDARQYASWGGPPFGNAFRLEQADPLRDQFAEQDGKKSNNDYDQSGGNIGCIMMQARNFFNIRLQVIAEFFSRIITRQDGDQGNADLGGGKKKFRIFSQGSARLLAFMSPLEAMSSSLDFLAETRAISAMTNKPFKKIKQKRIIIQSCRCLL